LHGEPVVKKQVFHLTIS